MENLAKFAWRMSIAIFTIVFLYVYASVGSTVGYNYNEYSQITDSISKNQFFYIGLIGFSLINFLLWSIVKLYLKSTSSDTEWTDDFKSKLRFWLLGLAAVINLFLVSIVSYILFINHEEGFMVHRYGGIVYAGIALLVIWAVVLVYILGSKFKSYSQA